MVIKITYGEQIAEEMGKDLTHWNLRALAMGNEAFFTFWPVDVLRFRKCSPSSLITLLSL
jgi:hypothetical protein